MVLQPFYRIVMTAMVDDDHPVGRTHSLVGKTVFITGAAGGIGAATARVLVRRGARVVLTDLNQRDVDAVAAELGPDTLPLAVDVTDAAALQDAMAAAVDRFGSVDVVMANAGIAADPPTTVATIDPAQFEKVVDVDLFGVWRTVRAALPQIIANRGYVLITSSVYAYANGAVNAPYAMAKAGVEQLGRALRVELAPAGASAGVLYPGWVRTNIARPAFGGDDTITRLRARAFPPLLRDAIEPEEVAEAVAAGIEKRSARIIVPRRWIPYVVLNGFLNPLSDVLLQRDRTTHRFLRDIERSAIESGGRGAG